ncbi:MAG: hypothetical protein ACMUIP_01900 [bacterium]
MKSLKRVIISCVVMSAVLLSNMAIAQVWTPLFPNSALLPVWSPVLPLVNPIGLPTSLPIGVPPIIPLASAITRSAQIPTVTTPVVVPTTLTTNWSGTWTSFLNTNQNGIMTLTLTEDLLTGTFTGTALLSLNSLIPVAIPVSGAYTGVGLAISVSGIYSTVATVTTGGGPFAVTTLVPVDYLLTLDFSIIAGAEIIGSYAINSLLNSDFGSFYLIAL